MGAMHYWANWLCSNNVEMYLFSVLMKVYASVNNLSVISGPFMNLWLEPVLSRTYKVCSQRTQHIGPGESQTSGPSDTALGYIRDLQLKLFKLREDSLVRYTPPTPTLAKTQRVVYLCFNPQTFLQ